MPYVNIHGHTHSVSMTGANYYNVSVEAIDYRPINFNTIVETFNPEIIE